MLSYLARYTHRVAIANSRLMAFDGRRVTFKCKDYRRQGRERYGAMTLDAAEFSLTSGCSRRPEYHLLRTLMNEPRRGGAAAVRRHGWLDSAFVRVWRSKP